MEQSRIPSISVIIPVYRGGENFRRCLSSVQRLAPRPLEVLVISDGGIEEDAELTREYGYQLLTLPSRVGPAGARNFAALRALGDVLFFLDADVEAPPDTLDHLGRAFQDNPKIAAVFGSYDD